MSKKKKKVHNVHRTETMLKLQQGALSHLILSGLCNVMSTLTSDYPLTQESQTTEFLLQHLVIIRIFISLTVQRKLNNEVLNVRYW